MPERDILIVEDERLVAEDIKGTLEGLGYNVTGITDRGDKAIEKVREKEPDLVLMDIVLKGDRDGVETADKIKSEFDIPVIYLTAYADDEKLKRARVTEPYGYIIKPFRERELHSNIEMAFYKHKMEEKLKQSERRYRAIFENSGSPMAIFEEDKTISLVNEKMEKLTGYNKEELEGKMKWPKFVSDSDVDRMEDFHEKRRENGEDIPNLYNFTLINRFGDAREMLLQVGMIPGTGKSIVSLTDVTKKRKRFGALRESQEAFRLLFENSHDAVALINPEGKCDGINDNFCELFGYSEHELTRIDCKEILTEESAEKFEEVIDKMFLGDLKEKIISLRGVTKEGDEISLEGKLSLVTGPDGKPLYTIWNIQI